MTAFSQQATEMARQAKSVWRELAETESRHLVVPESRRILVSGNCILTRDICQFADEQGEVREMEFARRFEVNPEIATQHEATQDIIADLLHYGREISRVEFVSWIQAIPLLLADEPITLANLQRRILK